MTDLIQRIIKLELQAIEINQELIARFKEDTSELAQLVVNNSEDAINNAKETIQFFSKM
jgi:DNA-binding protein YbaB